jgi:hypothetical protein
MSSKVSGPVDPPAAPELAPTLPAVPQADVFGPIATLVTTLVAALCPPVPVPAPADPAQAPAAGAAHAPAVVLDDSNNKDIDFLSTTDWLHSMRHKYPKLLAYGSALEKYGFDHINDQTMPDVKFKEFTV